MRRLLALLLLMPVPALAQDIDCADAQTTAAMTFCATIEFEAADGALNKAYAAAVETARGYDAGQEALLRDAQRAWIAFRDAACSAEGSLYEGGSAQPMIGTMCMTRLTQTRTKDLWAYAAVGDY